MKLNNKGFSLVELLAVMVILAIILTIAIPSITSSLARSEKKQLEAQKQNIVASALMNVKKSSFSNAAQYNNFNKTNSSCKIYVADLVRLGYVSDKAAKDKKGNEIVGCVGYQNSELIFFDTCSSRCGMRP